MKVSVITVVLNNREYVEDCIKSVLSQTYKNVEYIIVDGGSTNGTIEIIKKHERKISKWISEPDKGIYDAMNKGITLATGEIIGFLHVDDVYAHNRVIETVVSHVIDNDVDSCYGDLLYVNKKNPDKVVRYWKSCPYRDGLFRYGWMPPHPTFFVKREIYEKYDYFNTDFKIAADYELMLRFLERCKISTCYIPEVLIKMRLGGVSNRSLLNIMRKSYEDYKAWKVNNLNGGLYAILLKNISKIPQFFRRYNTGESSKKLDGSNL
jgi:glycosyltransferase